VANGDVGAFDTTKRDLWTATLVGRHARPVRDAYNCPTVTKPRRTMHAVTNLAFVLATGIVISLAAAAHTLRRTVVEIVRLGLYVVSRLPVCGVLYYCLFLFLGCQNDINGNQVVKNVIHILHEI